MKNQSTPLPATRAALVILALVAAVFAAVSVSRPPVESTPQRAASLARH
jgi:hypothetical protein